MNPDSSQLINTQAFVLFNTKSVTNDLLSSQRTYSTIPKDNNKKIKKKKI